MVCTHVIHSMTWTEVADLAEIHFACIHLE